MGQVSLSSMWRWWTGELRSLLPSGRGLKVSPARYGLLCDRDGYSIVDQRAGKADNAQQRYSELPDAASHLRRLLRFKLWRRSADVLIPQADCMVRRVNVPRASVANIEQILSLDVVRLVPGGPDNVLSGHQLPLPGDRSVSVSNVIHYIAKADAFTEAGAALRAEDISVERCGLLDNENCPVPVELSAHQQSSAAPKVSWAGRLLKVSAVAAAGMLFAAIYLAFDKQDQAIADLNEQVGTAKREALAVRKVIEGKVRSSKEIARVHAKKLDTYRIIEILEETTRILPDSAWVNNLVLKDGRIILSGFSRSAAELIGPLEASKLFSNATFASPVVMGRDGKAERFQIRLELTDRASQS